MSINIKSNTIFVSIASYRDNVCTKTVQSLYEMADNPNKVFVGLCQQNNNKEDPECITDDIRNKYSNVQRCTTFYFCMARNSLILSQT